jgi:hypothetical protein
MTARADGGPYRTSRTMDTPPAFAPAPAPSFDDDNGKYAGILGLREFGAQVLGLRVQS